MILFLMVTFMYKHANSEICPNPEPSKGCVANFGGHDCAWVTSCYDSACCRAISTCSGWCDGDSCIAGATCHCRYEVKESCIHSHTPHSHYPHGHNPHGHYPHDHYPSSGGGGGGIGGGGIAGIVIGSLVSICGLGFCLRIFYKSRRSDTQHLTELTLPGIKGPEDGTEQSPAAGI